MKVNHKKCTRCLVDKPLCEYYSHKQMADGTLNKCKDCCRYAASNNKTVPRVCLICNKSFMANANEVKRRGGGAKTCSRECYYAKHRLEIEPRNDKIFESKPMTYGSVHAWVKRKLGRPSLCVSCGTKDAKLYDWSNISGEYKRELADWQRLCRSCHIAYDVKHQDKSNKFRESIKATYKAKLG